MKQHCYCLILLSLLLCCITPQVLHAQCLSNSTGPGDILGDAPPQTISTSTSHASLNDDVLWSNGATGTSFTYTPDCGDIGPKSFTPCLPAGTTIPAQSVSLGPFSGTAPATVNFTISGLCFKSGSSCTASLSVNLGGSGNVNMSVTSPDGNTQSLPGLPISFVNANSPIDLCAFGLISPSTEANGNWSISIGGDVTTYNVGLTTIDVPAYSLNETECGEPVTFEVLECTPDCPMVAEATGTRDICSGGTAHLNVILNPANVTNASFEWTGDNGFSSTLKNPTDNPTNNTCDPITVSYSVTVRCTNDNSIISTNQVAVTVYPDINTNAVEIDNTTDIEAPDCAILVTVPCPNFLVNGQASPLSQAVGPGDNGTLTVFTISNGFPGCNVDMTVPVFCTGTCVTPVAAVTTPCIDANSYELIVNISDLSGADEVQIMPSIGTAQTATATGVFTFGPYTNDTWVNIKLINEVTAECNANLGNFSNNCTVCPELLGIDANRSGATCDGDQVILTAMTNSGILGQDYQIKWQLNGIDIPGGFGSPYSYLLNAQGCEINTFDFSAELVCLNGGTAASNTQDVAPTITTYGMPVFNVDFFRADNCIVLPEASPSCLGMLNMDVGTATDLSFGDPTILVDYTVNTLGAPVGCEATGTYRVSCPTCSDDAGNGAPKFEKVPSGESFDIQNTGSLATSAGFFIQWDARDKDGDVVGTYGPFANPGQPDPATFMNDGSLFMPGETYCFEPYLMFDGSDMDAGTPGVQGQFSKSGFSFLEVLSADLSCSASPDCDCILGIPALWDTDCYIVTPFIYSETVVLGGIPYCEGYSEYTIQISVSDNTTVGLFNPFNDPGAITSDFPAPLDEQHDDGVYTLHNYAGNPNGKSITIRAVYLNPIPDPIDPAQLSWIVTVSLDNPPSSAFFPIGCNSCQDIGQPTCIEMLETLALDPIANQGPLCEGTVVDLNIYNPRALVGSNIVGGTYVWYDGDPLAGGMPIANPENVTPTDGQTFYVQFESFKEDAYSGVQSVTFSVNGLPSLAAPTYPLICPGDTVDLSTLEASITPESGTFRWHVGNPDNGGALIDAPNLVIPVGSEPYFAVFENANGCSNKTSLVFEFDNCETLSVGAVVQIRAFLQGAYDTASGLMRTDLADGGLLPLTQPYTTLPWNYAGNEIVAAFAPDVVDWVLVELRDPTDNTVIVATKSALLLNNGFIQDINGSLGVVFAGIPTGDYYVVVRHRNHLAVISSTTITLPNLIPYDFTIAVTQALGTNQMSELAQGVYGLCGGDINGDGVITVSDFNDYSNQASMLNQYLIGDVTMDKVVSVLDFNVYNPNSSKIGTAQVRY